MGIVNFVHYGTSCSSFVLVVNRDIMVSLFYVLAYHFYKRDSIQTSLQNARYNCHFEFMQYGHSAKKDPTNLQCSCQVVLSNVMRHV